MTIDPNISPNSILYVDACVEKWLVCVANTDESRQGRLAYLLERESAFWRAILKEDGAPINNVDIDRMCMPSMSSLSGLETMLAPKETEFELVVESTQAALRKYFELDLAWTGRNFGPTNEAVDTLSIPFAERVHAYLLDYEKIVGR